MTVMDGAHDGIVCLDESFCITVFSRGAERIFGYGPEEVLGKTFDCLVPDSTNWLHGLKTAPERASRTTIRREAIARKKGGATFPAKLAGSLQEIEKAATVTMCMRDLSEHKLREEQLFEAQKAAMLGRMAASIAHDFKNLLAVVQGNAFLLGIEAPPNLAARISEINDAVARGVAITRQLLAYSRPRRALRKTVEINELVTKAEPLLRRLLREDIRLWVDLGADLGPAEGDPHLIEQVLMNLLANARDALPEGGEVSIRTSSYRVDSSAASAGEALAPGEYVSITVQDSGPGVPPDLKERIFEPFFTTKPSGVGTGLGLPSARSIARHGGGDVRLQATPGGGATFLVLLPRAIDSVAPEPPASAGRDQAAHGTETILVVEDDPKVLLATSQILGLGGYRVLNATSAAAALEIFETTGAVGLLLADIVMPGGSGRALARRLHAQAPDLPVLFMTAGADESAPEHESTLDGWPVLHKPLPPERLLRAVRDSLDSNRA